MVLNSVFSEHIIPVYNEDILNEYATVLRRKKFNFSEDFINETITTIKDNGQRLKIRCSRYPSSIFLLNLRQEVSQFRYMFLLHVGKGTLKCLRGQVHNGSFKINNLSFFRHRQSIPDRSYMSQEMRPGHGWSQQGSS